MDSDERSEMSEPIHVIDFEGEYVRVMTGSLPAITLGMEEGYRRGTHLKVELDLRVRNMRYEELTSKEVRETGEPAGSLKRVHIFALEEARIVDARSAEEADPGVGGSAGGSRARIEERFEIEGGARECWFDSVRLEVVHRGGCELCEGVSPMLSPFEVPSVAGTPDAGF